jgi:adenosylmethionine-8-amino-7-oxononanoate aminotransferase
MSINPNQSWPFVPFHLGAEFVRAEGACLYTPEGKRVYDAAGGAVITSIGHGRKEVAEATAKAMEELTFVCPPFATPQRVELVERLRTDWLPPHLTRAWFACSGSEAIDGAMRLARHYHFLRGQTEKHKVIHRSISYHGITLTTLGISGHPQRRIGLEPMWKDNPVVPAPYPLRYDGPADMDMGEYYAQCVEDVILREGPETVSCFVSEIMTGSSGGAIVPPDGYWERVQAICKKYDVLLVADEVMTGFGRTGTKFACDWANVRADIMVSGKSLACGYAPIAGLFATDDVVAPMAEAGAALMFHTYGAAIGPCAAANKVLEIMQREKLVERAAAMESVMRDALAPLNQHPHVAEVRGKGMLWGIEIVRDRETLEPFAEDAALSAKIIGEGLDRGAFFYFAGTGPVRDILVLGPPYISTESEIGEMAEILKDSIDAGIAKAIA